MYQSILFSRTPDEDQYSYFVRDDIKGIHNFKYFPTVYKLDEYGEYETLFGDRCSAIQGKYNRDDPNILEKDIEKELVALRDIYYETDDMPSFHNMVYLDIEIEILGALTPITVREANAEITSIALIDVNKKEKICFILDKEEQISNVSLEGKTIISCKNESSLILAFLDKWEQIDPTIVIGYNSDFFDIPYLYYRIKKKLGDEVLRLSPVKKIEENLYNSMSPIKLGLVSSLDFMLLLKKYISKEESSYKLNDIGLKYVKLGKIEYNGSLDKLFKDDPNKFIDYNIRDVEILEALEDKLKFVQLTILISHLCHTPYESIYHNTTLNEGAILTYLKRKNIIAPNKPTTINPSIQEVEIGDLVVHQRGTPTIEGKVLKIENKQAIIQKVSGALITRTLKSIRRKEGYAGGFLLEPLIGLHNWMFDEDVTSYYPFSIITLNIGIETLVGRILMPESTRELWYSFLELKEMEPNTELIIEKLSIRTYKIKQARIKVKDLINLIEKNNWNISANGVLYRTDIKSIAASVLEDWFNKRKEFKDLMKKAYKSGNKEKGDLYHSYQYCFKILLNSLYGTYAINGWRFTDGYKICSSSITCTGQRLISESIRFLNEEMEKEINL